MEAAESSWEKRASAGEGKFPGAAPRGDIATPAGDAGPLPGAGVVAEPRCGCTVPAHGQSAAACSSACAFVVAFAASAAPVAETVKP